MPSSGHGTARRLRNRHWVDPWPEAERHAELSEIEIGERAAWFAELEHLAVETARAMYLKS